MNTIFGFGVAAFACGANATPDSILTRKTSRALHERPPNFALREENIGKEIFWKSGCRFRTWLQTVNAKIFDAQVIRHRAKREPAAGVGFGVVVGEKPPSIT